MRFAFAENRAGEIFCEWDGGRLQYPHLISPCQGRDAFLVVVKCFSEGCFLRVSVANCDFGDGQD